MNGLLGSLYARRADRAVRQKGIDGPDCNTRPIKLGIRFMSSLLATQDEREEMGDLHAGMNCYYMNKGSTTTCNGPLPKTLWTY